MTSELDEVSLDGGKKGLTCCGTSPVLSDTEPSFLLVSSGHVSASLSLPIPGIVVATFLQSHQKLTYCESHANVNCI